MNKRHVPGNRLRLGRLMCGRSLTFRSNLGYLGLRPGIQGIARETSLARSR